MRRCYDDISGLVALTRCIAFVEKYSKSTIRLIREKSVVLYESSQLSVSAVLFPVDKQARLDHTTACFLSACSACVTTTGIDVRGRHEHVTRIEWKIQFRRGTARSRHAPANFLPTARRREGNVIRPAGTITTRVPDRRKTRKWEPVARFLSRRSVDSTHLCHFLRHRLLPEESKLRRVM